MLCTQQELTGVSPDAFMLAGGMAPPRIERALSNPWKMRVWKSATVATHGQCYVQDMCMATADDLAQLPAAPVGPVVSNGVRIVKRARLL